MSMSLKRAAKIIDISPTIMTDQHVMLNFESLINSGVNPEGVTQDELKQAKLVLLSRCYETQVRENERFDIQCPYDNPCPSCGGTGAKFKWYKSQRTKKCRCGDGMVNLGKCFACNGTGRFKRDDHGLRLDLECKKCNGTGERIVKCKFCRGRGRQTYLVLAPKVESFTICQSCKGFGYKPPQHIYNFNTPTIVENSDPNDLADMINALGTDVDQLAEATEAALEAVYPEITEDETAEVDPLKMDADDIETESSAEAMSAAPEDQPVEAEPTPPDETEPGEETEPKSEF